MPQTHSSTGWPGVCAGKASPRSASISDPGRPAWRTPRSVRDWSARGRDVVTCRCPGRSGRCRHGCFGAGPRTGHSRRIDWARLPHGEAGIPRGVGARSCRSTGGRGAGSDAGREAPTGGAPRQCSGAATQEASDRICTAMRSPSNCKRLGDQRGGGLLRPRHGFVDGRRATAHIEQGVGEEIPITLVMDHPPLPTWPTICSATCWAQRAAAPKSTSTVVTTRSDKPIVWCCRFPRRAQPGSLWDVLSGGVDAIREVRKNTFDIDEFSIRIRRLRARRTHASATLDGIDGFDPEFFGISRVRPSGSSRSSG